MYVIAGVVVVIVMLGFLAVYPALRPILWCCLSSDKLVGWLASDRRWEGATEELIKRGNGGEARKALLAAARDPDPAVSTRANWALFRVGDNRDYRFTLIKDGLHDKDSRVFVLMLAEKTEPVDAEYMPQLIDLLHDDDDYSRAFGIASLAPFLDQQGVLEVLLSLSRRGSSNTRKQIAASFGRGLTLNPGLNMNQQLLEALISLVHDPDPEVRRQACRSMRSYVGNDRAIAALTRIFKSGEPDFVRFEALVALSDIAPASHVLPLAWRLLLKPWNRGGSLAASVMWRATMGRYWFIFLAVAFLVLVFYFRARNRPTA